MHGYRSAAVPARRWHALHACVGGHILVSEPWGAAREQASKNPSKLMGGHADIHMWGEPREQISCASRSRETDSRRKWEHSDHEAGEVTAGCLPQNERQGLTTILLRARNQSEHAVVLPDPLSNFSVCAIRRPVL